VWEITAEETAGRVPVYAGTGAITTRQVIELNKVAEDAGADAVSIITPMFISPTQDELYEHYVAVADATSLPVILYNNPGRTGLDLSAGLVSRLAGHPNVVGIKDSSGDLSLTNEYVRLTGDDFHVLMGRDSLIFAALLMGVKGAIAATANVAPSLVAEIYEAVVAGDLERGLAAQNGLTPLRMAFGLATFPVVVKDAMEMIGLSAGPCRAPVRSITGENREKLRSVLEGMALLS
jgi:4-hydroxy-tetrahydrodipicolinate synthase